MAKDYSSIRDAAYQISVEVADKANTQERVGGVLIDIVEKSADVESKKVDKVAGKQLSTEDYTTTEKTKLGGIATGANNYIHPANHAPSIITQDANNRFVSDTEKATWNAKQAALGFVPETVLMDSVPLKNYGIAVRSFGGSALEVEDSKEPLSLTYERLSGVVADCGTAKMKRASKQLKMALTIGGGSVSDAMNNYCSFFNALTASDKRVISSTLFGKSFDCYYVSQSNLEMYGMNKSSTACFIDFEIILK